MKKITSLLIICLAVLCFFSSCAMEKPLEAEYRLYGHIRYKDEKGEGHMADQCHLFLYPDGHYTIDFVNEGTWKKDENDPDTIYLIASDPLVFSKMELEYDAMWHTLEQVETETTNVGFEIEGIFRFRSPL